MDAPENEKLVLKRSILGLGRVMSRDAARVLEQVKSCLRYGGTIKTFVCFEHCLTEHKLFFEWK